MPRYVVGIDEVGRGPLAGPMLFAAVITAAERKNAPFLKGIKDSKKLSEQQREEWYEKLLLSREKGMLDWRISFVTAPVIDKKGIAHCSKLCVRRVLKNLKCDHTNTQVLLDGGLYAPKHFVYQETITRGEEKERLIAAASIVAKVNRDRRMRNYADRFPEYGFDTHKGYGTGAHIHAIKRHGVCDLHRLSFLAN